MTMNNYPSRSSQKAIKILVVISLYSEILQGNVRQVVQLWRKKTK